MQKDEYTPVIQTGDNDCALAAMAMYFGVPYKRVLKLAFKHCLAEARTFDGTSITLAKLIASDLGRNLVLYDVSAADRKKYIGTPCILVSKSYKDNKEYHAMYWDGYSLWDPSHGLRYNKSGIRAWNRAESVWLVK